MTRPLRTAGGVLLIVVLLCAAAALGYVETHAARSPASAPARPSTPTGAGASALDSAGAAPASTPAPPGTAVRPSALARRLRPALAAGALGPGVHAEVIDVLTGRVLFGNGSDAPGAPASTAKLLTAAAVLATRGPQYRITTRLAYVASGTARGTLVLVGGGDPTLTAATGSTHPAYPGAARLASLVRAFRATHRHVSRIVVDDAAFAGPTVSPAWDADDVPSSYGAGITAVMTDGGRASPGAVVRSAAPDLAAGAELAARIGSPHLPVTRGALPSGARTVASVRSAPVSTLIEQMLQESDNVIAECLARQVAMVEHDPVTFTGAARAIRAVVQRRLGVRVGAGMVDGSGLAASDRLTVAGLAGVLRAAAGASDSGSGSPLGALMSGLPVAAWSGTLDDRYVSGSARAGAGVVRAKTGTLTGVSTLAGLVHDRGGRLLAFAILADRTGATPQAEAALDVAATRIATCGCG
ncbi:D-alanyl-D-alanine carboxypeptidase/D-alanyl-D-alanine-endopeptidase [Jatrophihabitans endophyticus]|uniref:D-alanyl-D-alanine carboxypeptidase/D-alanyl-D-alanine endopeptidase n=1 Tax=Jatrophihabitans endophyticus TaxID=1206085 RepID=UPI0019FDE107|nr:D-alanyl-D-alanine carboxypeptidase/D-alanyl-D-alanine-endopeptidase [Jatrophihabitans endophyticus]MBE7189282.1 D-alanyl-D-alanine carboxypeptidase/D-alanyl-D-alanine-endopeptidase [Jatrophihabitans endophyticus]